MTDKEADEYNIQKEIIKRCESCDCIITRFNEYVKSTGTCISCRDDEWHKGMEESLDGDYESIEWLRSFEKVIKELDETPYQGYNNRIYDLEDLTYEML